MKPRPPSILVLVWLATTLACTDAGSPERAPAAVVSEPAPAPEPKPAPEPAPEPEPKPAPVELELLAMRSGTIDLLTTDGEAFVRIDGQLLHVDARGRPIYDPERKDPAWSWPSLHETRRPRPEQVDAFGGPAERPIISLAVHEARAESYYQVYRLGEGSPKSLRIEHGKIEGFYTNVASWGDREVALPGWTLGGEYIYEAYGEDTSARQRKAWAAVERSWKTAPQGLASVPAGGPVPDLLGLIPMVLANDAEGNLHAIAHTLPPGFDPLAVMEEEDPNHFLYLPLINTGLLGGPVERHSTHEYVHLRWRPGETTPERNPLRGLEQARVAGLYLNMSATLTLAVCFEEARPWLGVLEGERWRILPSEGLPKDGEWDSDYQLDLAIDARGQAWLAADDLYHLPASGTQWSLRSLPAISIPQRVDEPPADAPERRVLAVDDDPFLLELAWAKGQLLLLTSVEDGQIDLLFRIVDGSTEIHGETPPAPVELPRQRRVDDESDP